jgi:hypothetical protein
MCIPDNIITIVQRHTRHTSHNWLPKSDVSVPRFQFKTRCVLCSSDSGSKLKEALKKHTYTCHQSPVTSQHDVVRSRRCPRVQQKGQGKTPSMLLRASPTVWGDRAWDSNFFNGTLPQSPSALIPCSRAMVPEAHSAVVEETRFEVED